MWLKFEFFYVYLQSKNYRNGTSITHLSSLLLAKLTEPPYEKSI